MKAINIYTYSRIQENMATEFENILSQRSKKLNVKVQRVYCDKNSCRFIAEYGDRDKIF